MKLYGLKVLSPLFKVQLGEPVFINEFKYYIQIANNNVLQEFKKIYKEDLALVLKTDIDLEQQIGQQKLYGYVNQDQIIINSHEQVTKDIEGIVRDLHNKDISPGIRLELLKFIKSSNLEITKALIDNYDYYKNLFDTAFANDFLTRKISEELGLGNINLNDANELLNFMENENKVKRLIKKN